MCGCPVASANSSPSFRKGTSWHTKVNITKRDTRMNATDGVLHLQKPERNKADNLVEFLAFVSLEFVKPLKYNLGIIPLGNVMYLFSHLSNRVFRDVSHFSSELPKLVFGFGASLVGKALKLGLPDNDFVFPFPKVFSKIKLLENLSFRGKNSKGNIVGIDVNAKMVDIRLRFLLLFNIGKDLVIGCKAYLLQLPSFLKVAVKPLHRFIALYRYHNPMPRSKGYGKAQSPIFQSEHLAGSGDVVIQSYPIDIPLVNRFLLEMERGADKIQQYLAWKEGGLANGMV